ncbi:MAG: peptidylprolyl isomerase [Fidelibacterota bacterium]
MKRLNLILLILFCACSKPNPKVLIDTDLGEIIVELYARQAPVTVKNFVKHIKAGTYKNASFYRVVRADNQPGDSVKIEVIQGGVRDEEQRYKPIKHESTRQTQLSHKNGVISMARSEPGTATTEFFICIGDQPELDYGGKRNPDGQGFAAFGKVIEGMAIVGAIHQQSVNGQYLLTPVPIITMRINN